MTITKDTVHTLKRKVRTLKRRCASFRVVEFDTGEQIIKALSVSNKDAARMGIAELLKSETPLWPSGACNMGMIMWVQRRIWYPFEARAAKRGGVGADKRPEPAYLFR